LTVHDICSSSNAEVKKRLNKKKYIEREYFGKILKERFGITYTDELRESIVKAIQTGTGIFIAKESNRVSIWKKVVPNHPNILVYYDRRRYEPFDAVDTKYEQRQHFGKRFEERAGITYTEEIRQNIVKAIQTGTGTFVVRRSLRRSVWRNVVPCRPDIHVVYDTDTHELITVLFGNWSSVMNLKRKSKSKK
jgi:hypothetical protein